MSISELLALMWNPPVRLFYMAAGFWMSQTLFAAIQLEVFTVLEARPLSEDELVEALKLEPRPVRALLGALVSMQLMRFRSGRYENSPLAAQWLVKGKPDYLGEAVAMLHERLYEPWGRLGRALQTNRPTSFDSTMGELFDYLEDRTEEQARFITGLHAAGLLPARALARRFDFSRFTHLADLGGGSGVYAIEVLRRFPKLKATLVERSEVCRIAQEYINAAGLGDQITTEARNIFQDPLPAGADLVLLSQVVHDFSPEENGNLFRHVHEQLPSKGMLLVSEWLMDEDYHGPLAAALLSLNMLVDTRSGRSYSFGDLSELLRAAGFTSIQRKPLYGAAQLVIAHKG